MIYTNLKHWKMEEKKSSGRCIACVGTHRFTGHHFATANPAHQSIRSTITKYKLGNKAHQLDFTTSSWATGERGLNFVNSFTAH